MLGRSVHRNTDAIPLRPASQHEVRVAAAITQTGSTHAVDSETVVTSADIQVELLAAVHDQVELDLIGSVQRDGAVSVTVTVVEPGGVEAEQSWTTVVPAGSSTEFALGAADGLAPGTETHGTIRNRRVR